MGFDLRSIYKPVPIPEWAAPETDKLLLGRFKISDDSSVILCTLTRVMTTKCAFDPMIHGSTQSTKQRPTQRISGVLILLTSSSWLRCSIAFNSFWGFKVHWYHDATIAILLELSILLGSY